RFTQERIYNRAISPTLLAYFPEYNNSSPYGAATPNRKGLSFISSVGSSDRIIEAEILVDLLAEVAGEGTPEQRKYSILQGGTFFRIGKLLQFKKDITLNVGLRNEQTIRDGQATIKFQSNMMDAGGSIEFMTNVDL